jgi:hypothetical protein
MISTSEARTLLFTAAFCAAAFMIALATIELLRETHRVEVVVAKADLAAAEVWQVLREAGEITRQAAAGDHNDAAG